MTKQCKVKSRDKTSAQLQMFLRTHLSNSRTSSYITTCIKVVWRRRRLKSESVSRRSSTGYVLDIATENPFFLTSYNRTFLCGAIFYGWWFIFNVASGAVFTGRAKAVYSAFPCSSAACY